MLTPEIVAEWIRQHGEHVYYWVRFPRDLPYVLRDGLVPRKYTGQGPGQPGLLSSEHHVYLLTNISSQTMQAIGAPSGRPSFAISLRHLHPCLIESDEDCIGAHKMPFLRGITVASHEEVAHLPGGGDVEPWPTRHADVLPWMERHRRVVSAPAWVEHSMAQGRVAYRGCIPPELLVQADSSGSDWRVADPGDPWTPWARSSPPSRYYRG